MSTLKRIAKNAGAYFVGNNILKIFSMVLVILIARYLGDVEYGKFTFAISFTGLFFIFLDMGTRILLVREIAQNKEKAPKIVANVLMFKIFSSIVGYGIIMLAAFLLDYSSETMAAVAIAALGLLFDNFATSISSIFQAYERLEFPVITKLIRILVRFAFTIPLLIKGSGFLAILIVYVAVQALNLLIDIVICYSKFVKLIFDLDKAYIISFIKRSFPFFLSGIFVSVYFRIDITLMSKIAPSILNGVYDNISRDAVIGWYSSAYNLLDAVTSLPVAVSAAILPVAVIYFKQSRDKLLQLYNLCARFLTYLSLPIAVGISLLASKIILILYKTEYANAVLALQILIWALVPLCINYMMGAVMIAIHEEKKGVIVLFLNCVVNIALNLILIPRYSLYGAAASTVLTELFYFGGYYYIISKNFSGLDFIRILFKPVIASGVMGLFIYFLRDHSFFDVAAGKGIHILLLNILHISVLIGIGILVYGFMMLLLKAFNSEDFKMVQKILKKA